MMTHAKSIYLVLCLMAGVCALSGCIEEYEADISEDDANLLVVEGAICSSQYNTFYLSHTNSINASYQPQMVWGAKVYVRGTDGSEYTTQQTDGGYTCWIGALSPDVEYYLHIETDGEVYESEPQKPLRTERIVDISVVQNTPGSNIDVLVTPDEPFDPDKANYYLWTYDETWEVHPDYTTMMYYDIIQLKPVTKSGLFPARGWKNAIGLANTVAASHNYEGQHIRRLKIYDIDRGSERMYYRYSALIHQRAISKAEYEYELARRQAGSEMGGLFTPLPSALPTNIHCLTSKKHVIGFVGCALNTSKYRFFVTPDGFSIYRPVKGDARQWVEDPSSTLCCKMVADGLYLCEWIDETMKPGGKLRTAWAYDYQLDVRCWGAYIEEPVFWSLKEDGSEY